MTEGDRCPRNTCPTGWARPHPLDSAHRYGWPPSSTWGGMGRGLLDFRAPPVGFQGGDLRVGFVWVTLPPQAQLQRDGPLVGGRGTGRRLVKGIWVIRGQPCSPTAMLAFK